VPHQKAPALKQESGDDHPVAPVPHPFVPDNRGGEQILGLGPEAAQHVLPAPPGFGCGRLDAFGRPGEGVIRLAGRFGDDAVGGLRHAAALVADAILVAGEGDLQLVGQAVVVHQHFAEHVEDGCERVAAPDALASHQLAELFDEVLDEEGAVGVPAVARRIKQVDLPAR